MPTTIQNKKLHQLLLPFRLIRRRRKKNTLKKKRNAHRRKGNIQVKQISKRQRLILRESEILNVFLSS